MCKTNRVVLLLSALFIVSIAVAGCGGSTQEPAADPQEDSVADSEIPSEEVGAAEEAEEQMEPAGPEVLFPAEGEYIPGTSVTFKWEPVEHAEDHRLRITRESDGIVFYNQITNSTESNHTVFNFANDGELYCWQVSVLDADGWGDWSEVCCFTNSEP